MTTSAIPAPTDGRLPELALRRLLIVITGSANAAFLPFWMNWLRTGYPRTETTVLLTRSAQRFVTRQAVDQRATAGASLDVWPDEASSARHVELEQWADGVIVYPATLHYTGRFAQGLADSPSLLALQCTVAPIALAPALPPGGLDSAAFRAHWATLTGRRNVVLVPPEQGRSTTTGRREAWTPPPLPEVIAPLERRRAELAADIEPFAPPPYDVLPRDVADEALPRDVAPPPDAWSYDTTRAGAAEVNQ